MEIVIDGLKFDNLEGFYNVIEELLVADKDFHMGRNLDAFNDVLGGGFGVHECGEDIVIRWINFSKSREALGYAETAKYYSRKLQKASFKNYYNVKERLVRALEHEGMTLLDMIIDIIKDDETGHSCELIIEE